MRKWHGQGHEFLCNAYDHENVAHEVLLLVGADSLAGARVSSELLTPKADATVSFASLIA